MAGLESFNMNYQRIPPSRSISEHPPQPIVSDIENQRRETLLEMYRQKGKF